LWLLWIYSLTPVFYNYAASGGELDPKRVKENEKVNNSNNGESSHFIPFDHSQIDENGKKIDASPPLTPAMQRLKKTMATISADNTPGPSRDRLTIEEENRRCVQNDIWREGLSENSKVVGAIKREMEEGLKFQVHPIGKTPEMVKEVILKSGLRYIHKKSADEGAEHEVAAYYVGEKVLGLKNTFPITVWRDNGSAQLWVDNLTVGRDQLPNNDARVVDYILGHRDRITGYVPHKEPFKAGWPGNINWGHTSESSCVLFDNESAFPRKVLSVTLCASGREGMRTV